MFDIWFQHLSESLKGSDTIAYIWDVSSDSYQWAGDMYEALGLQQQDYPLSNSHFNTFLNPQDIPERAAAVHSVVRSSGKQNVDLKVKYRIKRANGVFVDVEETANLRSDGANGSKHLCGFIKILDKQQKTADPAFNSGQVNISSDSSMTHYGRMSLSHRIEEWAETAHENNKPVTGHLLAVGIDRLSMMNEAFGARYTDELIEKTGQRLRQISGDNSYVSRIDGDVFGVFFEQAPHSEMASFANYILNNFYSSPLDTSKGPLGISVSSGGITLSSNEKIEAQSIITKAEMALQSAKENGRGSFVSYSHASDQAAHQKTLLKSADQFLQAIRDDRVMLAFQPIIDSISEDVCYHESLIRMRDEDGKLLPAGNFVPAIEKLGLSRLVDQYAMRMAIKELSVFPDLQLTVNVSNLTLTHQDWLRGLVAALRDKPNVAKRLVIEVTESAVSEDPDKTFRVIRTLKDLGCKIALDDFGAGYTAFSQIKDMELDIVKIDKSFVRNIDEGQNSLFVKTLQMLADGVNVKTIGEGAETMADAKRLASDGIDYIQGYVYGFPQVERVWLPKEHEHRKFELLKPRPVAVQADDEVYQETMDDIKLWNKQN